LKNPISPFFYVLVLILILFSNSLLPVNAQTLAVTVTTEKPAYYQGESILIYGNLTLDGVPVTDGLVGLQIQDSTNDTLTIRTSITGTISQVTPYVKVWSVTPCDSNGNPKDSFKRRSLSYFKLSVTNFDIESRQVLMTVNLYDLNNVSFGLASLKTELSGQTTSYIILSIPIPTDATLGTATAYANAYTDWPIRGGTPYCNEVSAQFQITATIALAMPQNQQSTTVQTTENYNYNLTFKLTPLAESGNYTVYATSEYQGRIALTNTTLRVLLKGDFDADDDIDYDDIVYFVTAYIIYWSGMGKDPLCDFDGDCDIDYDDIVAFITAYIRYWS